jgi:HCOMODA/2-hydroxy-3-carboxy-muconic semialdehyde decarboxylase
MSRVPHDHLHTDIARDMRLAARAMARHGLAHAYGHVSARIDDRHFLVSPARPLGTVAQGDPGVIVPIDGDLPDGALPEVRIHREIYRRRPEVGGICRFQSPSVIALSALEETPRALHGLGTYFAPAAPLWPDVQLVRDDERAVKVAETMGDNAAIVLRGNGAVTAGATIAEAAAFAFYLEDAARIEIALLPARAAGREPREYTTDESARRAVKAGALIERMWQFLCFGDPEWQPAN